MTQATAGFCEYCFIQVSLLQFAPTYAKHVAWHKATGTHRSDCPKAGLSDNLISILKLLTPPVCTCGLDNASVNVVVR